MKKLLQTGHQTQISDRERPQLTIQLLACFEPTISWNVCVPHNQLWGGEKRLRASQPSSKVVRGRHKRIILLFPRTISECHVFETMGCEGSEGVASDFLFTKKSKIDRFEASCESVASLTYDDVTNWNRLKRFAYVTPRLFIETKGLNNYDLF